MKIRRYFCFFLIIILAFSATETVCAAPADSGAAAGSYGLHGSVALVEDPEMLKTTQAAIAYELNTDTLLFAKDPDKRINPTGLVKLLTALIVLEEADLNEMATVYRNTLDTIALGAVSAGLKAGEQVAVGDLLKCVMVASANDAAAVMAAHVAGTQSAFVERMNQRAKELGCIDSNFTNVHGLMDENQYSTARDLAIIVEAALENDAFAELFSLEKFSMPATNMSQERYFVTTNYLMSDEYYSHYFDYRVTGGKPAAATSADRSVICTAKVGNSRYLFVLMSVECEVTEQGGVTYSNFLETIRLMNYAFNNFTVRQVLDKEQAIYQYAVKNGKNDVLVCGSRDVSVLLPADFDKNSVVYENIVHASALQSPIVAGDPLGTLQIKYGGRVLASCDLLAMNQVERQDDIEITDRLQSSEDPGKQAIDPKLVFAAILVAVLAGFVAVLVLIIRGMKKIRSRRGQMRKARKRKRSR